MSQVPHSSYQIDADDIPDGVLVGVNNVPR
jgi:hypothetical protein